MNTDKRRFGRLISTKHRSLDSIIYLGLSAFICGLISFRANAGVFYPDGATTLHFAFEGSPNGDRPIIRPPAFYQADDGFGFVDSPTLIGTSRGVTAPKYFRFDVNLPEGIYDVTVTLGGAQEESITSVKAENHQPMLENIQVARGQNSVKTFTVKVKRGAAGATALESDARLNLEFEGTNPSLMKLDIKPSDKPMADAALFVPEAGFVALFNGKDLTGWHHKTPTDEGPALDGKTDAGDGRYTVKDGVLVGNADKEKGGRQLLWTTKEFKGNFVLRFEFRSPEKTDGGLFFNKTQLQCGDYSSYAYRTFKAYRPLDWNVIEVTMKDGVARCTCNDEVLEAALKVPEPGQLGFEADKGGIEYRRIQIQALP